MKPISIIKMAVIPILAIAMISVSGCKKDEDADQAAYDAADGRVGARFYDHPFNEAKDQDPSLVIPTNVSDNANFFRCKSCHGWDLLGQEGVNIGKTPSATYPTTPDINLYAEARADDIRKVFDHVKNTGGRSATDAVSDAMPDYGSFLTDAQIWDIVKFLRETSHNTSEFYDLTTTGTYPNGTKSFSNIGKGGNAANGLTVYNAKCASCHGADGTSIDIYCNGIYLGDMFRNDPHEIQHKAPWGMPTDRSHIAGGCNVPFGGIMPLIDITDQDIRDMMVMGQDTVAFPGF